MTQTIKSIRCIWALKGNKAYQNYHDRVWGVPVHNDREHFAMLTLEGAQAGLSWQVILNKVAGYKACFADFDIDQVAHFDKEKIRSLCQDSRIVRNQQKICATIHNARCLLALQASFGTFDHYIWSFVDNTSIVNHWKKDSEVPTTTLLAKKISKELKRHGFKFVGPTIVYAYMQAVGLVNDHIISCFRYQEINDGACY